MVAEPVKNEVKTEKMDTSTGANLDMTLADIIKANKVKQKKAGRGGKARGGGRGGARGRGIVKRGAQGGQGGPKRGGQQTRGRGGARGAQRGGAPRRGAPRGNIGKGGIQLATLRANMKPMFQARAMPSGPAKLLISNLDQGVTDSDIYELFAEFGTISEAAVHYDRLGRSVSTAHVGFARHVDAVKALKQYNGVNLDGRPMNITIEIGPAGGRGGGKGGRGGVAQRVNLNINPAFAGGQMGGGVKRLQQSQRLTRGVGAGNRGRGGMRGGMRGRGRGGYNVNVAATYGFNKTYNVGVAGAGNRGAFRGRNRGRGGMRGRGAPRGRGGAAVANTGNRGGQGGAAGKKGAGRGGNRGGRGGKGAGRGGKGAGRGGKQQKKTPTVEELDAELDSYLNETA